MNATATRDASEILQALRSLGFELTPRQPDRIHYRFTGDGDPPRAATPLLEALRLRKAEALELLTPLPWNEADARRRLEAVWQWADDATPPGCWASLSPDARRHLQADLDAAYDRIDAAFRAEDTRALADGFEAFRSVVLAAVERAP